MRDREGGALILALLKGDPWTLRAKTEMA